MQRKCTWRQGLWNYCYKGSFSDRSRYSKKRAAEASCHDVCKRQNNCENVENKGETAIANTKKVWF
jgi:hypothetical protein